MGDTNVSVSGEVWMELNSRKRPGDTFDDVLRRLLDMNDKDVDAPNVAIDSTVSDGSDAERAGLPDDLPTTVDRADARKAIDAAAEYLQGEGAASKREIVAAVMPDHSLGYDVPELESGERYRGAWWRRVVKPGLEMHDSVEKPPAGRSEWLWTGDDVST